MDLADEEYHEINSMVVEVMCAEQGLVMSLPCGNELQVDLDTRADWDRFKRSWEVLARNMNVSIDDITVTKSRNKEDGRHVRISLPATVTPTERIALQAVLGSDPVRELLSFLRLRAGDPRPTLFIEKPGFDQPEEPAEFVF